MSRAKRKGKKMDERKLEGKRMKTGLKNVNDGREI